MQLRFKRLHALALCRRGATDRLSRCLYTRELYIPSSFVMIIVKKLLINNYCAKDLQQHHHVTGHCSTADWSRGCAYC